MTNTFSELFILLGTMGDGKTTVGNYIVHKLKQPCVIFDPADEFPKNEYRFICHSVSEVLYYLRNKDTLKSIRKANMQIVFKVPLTDTRDKVNEVCKELLTIKGFCIFFDEMELYADRYLNKNHEIFHTIYLLRNKQHNIVCVAKRAAELSPLIKSMFTYIFVGSLEQKIDLNFFRDLGGKELEQDIKKVKFRNFLIIGRRGFRKTFTLNSKIAKILG